MPAPNTRSLDHRIVEWSRLAQDIPLQEQFDTGGQTNYVQLRPGPWASATCACGETRSGDVADVMAWARAHEVQ